MVSQLAIHGWPTWIMAANANGRLGSKRASQRCGHCQLQHAPTWVRDGVCLGCEHRVRSEVHHNGESNLHLSSDIPFLSFLSPPSALPPTPLLVISPPPRLISPHPTSSHLIPPHPTSSHLISPPPHLMPRAGAHSATLPAAGVPSAALMHGAHTTSGASCVTDGRAQHAGCTKAMAQTSQHSPRHSSLRYEDRAPHTRSHRGLSLPGLRIRTFPSAHASAMLLRRLYLSILTRLCAQPRVAAHCMVPTRLMMSCWGCVHKCQGVPTSSRGTRMLMTSAPSCRSKDCHPCRSTALHGRNQRRR